MMKKILPIITLFTSLNANATLGPVPIYLNTEYRTDTPIIGSIASTITFNKTDIEATGANTFFQLLASIPTVGFVNQQGNIPAIFLRGNEARHALVLIDGIKVHDISSPDGAAGYALEAIPLAQIERIEIVKGPFSALYGSGAVGGVIQIFTKKGSDYHNANISAGSNNSKKISVSSSNKSNKGFVNFNASKYQTNGISALKNNSEKDGIDNQSIGFKIGYNLSENTDFSLGFLQSKIDTEYDDAFGFGGFNHNKNWHKELENMNLILNHKFEKVSSKLLFAKINQNRDSFTNGISDGFNNKKYQTKDLSLLNDIKLNKALLTIGFSKIDDENITDNQTLSSKDIFTQWQKNISGFDINTGVRFIDHSDFGRQTVYNLGIAKILGNGIKLTGSFGTAFNSPTLYQLNGNIADNIDSNPNLEPETSQNAEIGIEKQHFWGISNLKIYKNRVKNLIDYVDANCSNGGDISYPAPNFSATCPAGENLIRASYQNEDKLNIKGIELEIAANIKKYAISFSHNFVDSKLNNSNTQQKRRPKNTTNLTISKTYNKYNSRLQIIKKSSSLDTKKLNGYTLVNLSTAYHYNDKTKISFVINNVFDKNYTVVNGYNQLGRTLNIGLNYNF